MTKRIIAVVSVVKVKKLKLVNYEQIIIETPSAANEQREIIWCCRAAVTFSASSRSLSSRDERGRARLCSTPVCVMGQGSLIRTHSDSLQVFRAQCCNIHVTIELYNMRFKRPELLRAFIQDLGDVKSHAEIARTTRTYSSQLKEQNYSADFLIKPFNKS